MEAKPYAENADVADTNGDAVGKDESPAVKADATLAEVDTPPLVQLPLVHIERQVYSQQGFFHRYPPIIKEKVPMDVHVNTAMQQAKKTLKPTKSKCQSLVRQLVPCISHMRHYQWRHWFIGDLISGLTLGTIHIPQCLAYSAIVQVNAAFGLYTSFFSILVYFVFGSSHGISVGTVAVMSLLAGNFVTSQYDKYAPLFPNPNITATTGSAGWTTGDISTITAATSTIATTLHEAIANSTIAATTVAPKSLNMECTIAIAVTASFVMGLIQLGLGTFQLGIISALMSTPFNSAYMTATAFVTAVSQIPPALGFKIGQYPGLFTLPYQLRDIFLNLYRSNPADVITSIITITWLIFIKEFINVKYRKKLPFLIPSELVVVIVGTGISYGADLHGKYNMKIVGDIPLGFPAPAVPGLITHIDGDFVVGCITMTIVGCIECLTMAKILARKYRYHIDANQEFRAYGLVHLISSFFHAYPTAQSPPRSMIFDTTGGKTQLSSLFAALLVLIVIVGAGPLLQNLPKACLACIVIVGVFPLLKHVKELKFYWKVQKWDFVGWILTCLSVLALDLAVGLGVGIGWNLLIILAQSVLVRGYTEVSTNEPDIFLRSKAYYNTREIEGIRIFRFESDLFFANAESFKNQLFDMTVNPHKVMLVRKKAKEIGVPESALRRRSTVTRVQTEAPNNNVPEDPKKVGYFTQFGKLVKGKLGRSSPNSYDVASNNNNIPMQENVYSVATRDLRDNGGYVNQAIEVVPSEYTEIPADVPSSPAHKTVTLVEPPTHPLAQPLYPISEQAKEQEEIARRLSTSSMTHPSRQRTSVTTAPAGSHQTQNRTSSAISWQLPGQDSGKIDTEHAVLPDADFSAGEDEDEDNDIGNLPAPTYTRRASHHRTSLSHHHDADDEDEGTTSEGLKSFYKKPNLDFVAIDEDRVEMEIQEEVEEIRSHASVPADHALRPAEVDTIILDCSPIAYVDFNGLLVLRQLFEDYREVEIRFLLAACGRFMLDKLKTSAIYEEFGQQIYPTVFDAVMAAQAEPAENFFTSHV